MENQIVYFNKDGKLVVEANNGMITDNGSTEKVILEGQFEIGATDVGILLAMLGEKTIRREGRKHWAFGFYNHDSWAIISRDEAIKQLDGIIKDKQVEMLELQAENARLERLIREHNAKCGIFGKKIELCE
jgi:hypothetical protein